MANPENCSKTHDECHDWRTSSEMQKSKTQVCVECGTMKVDIQYGYGEKTFYYNNVE